MAATIISFIINLINSVSFAKGDYVLDFYGWRLTYGDAIFDLYRRCDELRLTRRQAKWLAKRVSHYLTVGVAGWDMATNVRVTTKNADGEWVTKFRVGGITSPYSVEHRGMCGAMANGYPRYATVGIRKCD